MKTAICYFSHHHGNTLNILKAMAQEGEVDLIDVTTKMAVHLEGYDLIGFASGIYAFHVHKALVEFIRQYLPQGKKVFFVYTYGGFRGTGAGDAIKAATEKGAENLGEYSCTGWNTVGPFKLMGGTYKGRPNDDDRTAARTFFRQLQRKL